MGLAERDVGGGQAVAVEEFDDKPAEKPQKPPSAMGLKPLEPLERRVGLWVAVITAAAQVGIWTAFWDSGGAIGLPIGLTLSAALGWASQRRGRLATGIAAFVVSMAWPIGVVGMPIMLFGLWLWFRGRPSPDEIAERQRLRAEANAAKRAARRGQPVPTKKTPPQSKRYTPPANRR